MMRSNYHQCGSYRHDDYDHYYILVVATYHKSFSIVSGRFQIQTSNKKYFVRFWIGSLLVLLVITTNLLSTDYLPTKGVGLSIFHI